MRGIGRYRRSLPLAAVLLFAAILTPAAAQAVSFTAPTNFPAGFTPESLGAGDFNGDSRADLAVTNIGTGGSSNVSILLGAGSGMFTGPTSFPTDSYPYSVAVGDFTGDSHLDLATANANSNNVSILLGSGGGSFS